MTTALRHPPGFMERGRTIKKWTRRLRIACLIGVPILLYFGLRTEGW